MDVECYRKNEMEADEMNLSFKHQEMVKGLIELGISQKVIAFMMFLLPEEKQIVRAAKYISEKADEGKIITDEMLLEYLTSIIKDATTL